MDDPDPRRWRLPAHSRLVWRHWDGEYVVHHALSNDTHRLSELPGQIIARLAAAGDQSEKELADHLALDENDTCDILEELATLDFVTCRA